MSDPTAAQVLRMFRVQKQKATNPELTDEQRAEQVRLGCCLLELAAKARGDRFERKDIPDGRQLYYELRSEEIK